MSNSKRDKKGRFIKGNTPWSKTQKGVSLNTGKTHFKKGHKHSEETKLKISQNHRKNQTEETKRKLSKMFDGEKSYIWKGDEVGYVALHEWVRKHLGKPDKCEWCGKSGLKGCEIHWANRSGKYLRNLDDWLRLCQSCHYKFDKM